MVNSTEPRLAPRVKLAIEQIRGIIPNVISENCVLIMTNTTEGIAPNFDAKLLDTLIKEDRTFKIENSMFKVDIKKATK